MNAYPSDFSFSSPTDCCQCVSLQGTQPHDNDHPMPVLVDVIGTAKMLAVSTRSVWRLVETGQLPQPLHVGRSARWRILDVLAFIEILDLQRTNHLSS